MMAFELVTPPPKLKVLLRNNFHIADTEVEIFTYNVPFNSPEDTVSSLNLIS